MKDKKRRLEAFPFFDYTGIARHLAKMAEEGWLLERISNFGWIYRRITPKKLTFSVCYYPKASAFDPAPTEAQREFHTFCEHTGWVLAATSAQMQIFYNEEADPIPIETDPALEVETIHAAAKKSYLPGYFFLLLVAILDCALFVYRLFVGDWIGLLASGTELYTIFALLLLVILCVTELCGYFRWRKKALNAAARGVLPESHGRTLTQKLLLAAALILFASWLITVVLPGEPILGAGVFLMALCLVGVGFFAAGVTALLKRVRAPRTVNRAVTYLTIFVLSFALVGGTVFLVLRAVQSGALAPERETYEYQGTVFTVYQDALPLTVEDLLDVRYDGYIRQRSGGSTPLLGQFEMWQHPRLDAEHASEMPDLRYTITEVRLPLLYDLCKNSLLREKSELEHYDPTDPSPWRAKEAYRLNWDGYLNTYLLCYKNKLIEIHFSWEPTPAQMAVVAEKLSGEIG